MVGVPDMRPVDSSMPSPAGNPVAAKESVVLSAMTCSEKRLFLSRDISDLFRMPGRFSKEGGASLCG